MNPLREDVLSHELPYDPAKAREYYLRTRKLKGRKKGSVAPTGSRPKGAVKPAMKNSKSALQRRKETKARVEALNGRLEALRKVLQELVAQAKGRSGIAPKATKATKAKAPVKKANSAGSSNLTAAQKREAAKKAKERYEKEKGANISLTDQEKILQGKVEDIQKKISKAKQDLVASIQRAKKQQASKPAATSRRNS